MDPSGSRLTFENLAELRNLAETTGYRYQGFSFDNQERLTALAGPSTVEAPSIPLPKQASTYLMARIETLSPEEPRSRLPVDVYVRNFETKDVARVDRSFR